MSNHTRFNAISVLVYIALSPVALSACTTATSPESQLSSGSNENAETDHITELSIGTENQLVKVQVDKDLTIWLNIIDDSSDGLPPTPDIDSWQNIEMPQGDDPIVIDPSGQSPFDLLEILAYPDGLDDDGVPGRIVVFPLCGPQAEHSCEEISTGATGVQLPAEVVQSAIADTEYFALGGILLPNGDAHPDSFMVLLKNVHN